MSRQKQSCLFGPALFILQGDLPPLAEKDEVLALIEKIGVDQMALDGGFVAPNIDTPVNDM